MSSWRALWIKVKSFSYLVQKAHRMQLNLSAEGTRKLLPKLKGSQEHKAVTAEYLDKKNKLLLSIYIYPEKKKRVE